jgi:hypothetical protein
MAHTEQEILSGLAEIVNEVAGVPAADVQLDKSFIDDLDVDSLSMDGRRRGQLHPEERLTGTLRTARRNPTS